MKVDQHTPCPACPVHVRSLYAIASVVGQLLEQSPANLADEQQRALEQAGEQLRIAVRAIRPFVDAHQGNQLHALSHELVDARAPLLEETAAHV